jgi:hypothetical protein
MIVHYKPAFVLFFESLYCRAKKPHSSPPLLKNKEIQLKQQSYKNYKTKTTKNKELIIKQGA